MSFGSYEGNDRQGGIVTLYRFSISDTDRICYNDGDDIEYFEDNKYEKIAISRSDIASEGSLNKQSMDVVVPENSEIAMIFRFYPPSYVVTLEIFEGHFDDRERHFVQIWEGRVLNARVEDDKTTLSCELASTSLRRIGLRRNYQRQCPHDLYGPGCRATKTEITLTAIRYEKQVLVTTEPENFSPEMFATGVMTWVGSNGRKEIRSIVGASVDGGEVTFVLGGPVLSQPSQIKATKGCLHNERTCVEWHDNILNFGGQPWIPERNPIGTSATYL